MLINYQDTVVLAKLKSGAYANQKTIDTQATVSAVFLQNTDFVRSGGVENFDSDAVCYIDPTDPYVIANNYRLEGFVINAPEYDVQAGKAWYKVERVEVNRDHLLTNGVDNVRLLLSKYHTPVGGVS